MYCPFDEQQKLIRKLTNQGVEIDYCDKCGGIWLDKGELFYFVKNPRIVLHKILQALHSKNPSSYISPKSLSPMAEINYPGGPDILYCEQSGGMWFQKKDLAQIISNDKNVFLSFDKYKPIPQKILYKKLSIPYYFFRSFLAIIGIYIPLMAIIFPLLFFSHMSSLSLLAIIAGYALVIFALAGKIMDYMLHFFFKMKFKSDEQLPEYLCKFIRRLCKKNFIKYPKIGIIDDCAPQIFCYGSRQNSARIILTRGTLETLKDSEVNALVAHEIGHIVNRDIVLMTAAQIIPVIGYYFYKFFWKKSHGKSKILTFVNIIPANIFFFIYIITQWPILWFSRVREYYADVFAGENITNPSHLAQALIKVAYGMASHTATKNNIDAAGAMGVFDQHKAIGLAITSFPDRQLDQEINFDLLTKSMRWDLWSPWAKLQEICSTHPIISKRIHNLMLQGRLHNQDVFMEFNDKQPESYWDNFLIELFIVYLPRVVLLSLLGAGTYLYYNTIMITNMQEITFALGVIGFGLALLIKHKFFYPSSFFPALSVSSLLKKANVSKAKPIAATLQGKMVGKGIPDFIVTDDYIFQDSSGILILDYKKPYHIWNNIFSILKTRKFYNKDVIIEGWYHRGEVPYFIIKSITCDGETYFNIKSNISKFFCYTVLFLGFAWILQIFLFLYY